MSVVAAIADAVTDRLNAGSFSQAFVAKRLYQPTFELPELDTLRVSVVPRGLVITGAARRMSQYEAQVDVGIQRRLTADLADADAEVDGLMTLSEEIADHLRFERLPVTPEAAWVAVSQDPLLASEHLEEHRQFTTVLALTYRVLR